MQDAGAYSSSKCAWVVTSAWIARSLRRLHRSQTKNIPDKVPNVFRFIGLLGPFLTQSDVSVENGRFRLKPKSGFLKQSKKGLFDSIFFDRVFRLGNPVEKLDFFDWICQSKNSVEKVLHLFLNPSHRPSHHKTHTHTPTHPYQVPHSSIIQQRRRCLGYHCCCFSPQVSVAHS